MNPFLWIGVCLIKHLIKLISMWLILDSTDDMLETLIFELFTMRNVFFKALYKFLGSSTRRDD